MRNHAVSLHLAKTKSTITAPAFGWLPCQDLSWTSTTRVNLVLNHMFEPLIVSGTQENHNFHLLACEAVVHHFIAS